MKLFRKREATGTEGRRDTREQADDAAYPRRLQQIERLAMKKRREAAGMDPADPQLPIGLACSGGGIRSATVCLGVLQALARARFLRRIDFLSTVSGGGIHRHFSRASLSAAVCRSGERSGRASDGRGGSGRLRTRSDHQRAGLEHSRRFRREAARSPAGERPVSLAQRQRRFAPGRGGRPAQLGCDPVYSSCSRSASRCSLSRLPPA